MKDRKPKVAERHNIASSHAVNGRSRLRDSTQRCSDWSVIAIRPPKKRVRHNDLLHIDGPHHFGERPKVIEIWVRNDHAVDAFNTESKERGQHSARSNGGGTKTSTVVQHTCVARANQIAGTICDIEHVDANAPRDLICDAPTARWSRQ